MLTESATFEPHTSPLQQGSALRLLFVKDNLAWPRSSGHDVHTYYLMQALARKGHTIGLATMSQPTAAACEGLDLAEQFCFASSKNQSQAHIVFTKAQEKFRSYWGVDEARIRWVSDVAKEFQADAVVVVGLNVLPYLGAIQGPLRVWYAADEWVWHHFSQVKAMQPSTWKELKPALVKGLYERAYRKMLDRVWVVSEADAKAFRWFAGTRKTDVMPNGVDAEAFCPGTETPTAQSCVFWGRLDFGPNIQAIEWFCTKVWPAVRAKVPGATLTIYGFQPTPAVMRFAGSNGVTVIADLPDIRSRVRSHAAVVLPFVSGGGIKNKLLEAAGMAMPIVCTSKVANGLKGTIPFAVASSVTDWVHELTTLWADNQARVKLGRAAREWVLTNHTWAAAADTAIAGLRLAKGVRT